MLDNREDVRATGDVEDSLDRGVGVGDRHLPAAAHHGLLNGEEDAQAGRGDIFEFREVEEALFLIIQLLIIKFSNTLQCVRDFTHIDLFI